MITYKVVRLELERMKAAQVWQISVSNISYFFTTKNTLLNKMFEVECPALKKKTGIFLNSKNLFPNFFFRAKLRKL